MVLKISPLFSSDNDRLGTFKLNVLVPVIFGKTVRTSSKTNIYKCTLNVSKAQRNRCVGGWNFASVESPLKEPTHRRLHGRWGF